MQINNKVKGMICGAAIGVGTVLLAEGNFAQGIGSISIFTPIGYSIGALIDYETKGKYKD